jgi:cyclase
VQQVPVTPRHGHREVHGQQYSQAVEPTHHTRVLRPAGGVYAFYDGRVEGYRFAGEPNWVDEGAISLGVCSYAIVEGSEALVYDTHVSLAHARVIREMLEREGAREFTVVLSHWHLDHVAGTAAFPDSEVLATERTAELLRQHRNAIEAGSLEGPPAIDPLVLPTKTFRDRIRVGVGRVEVELIHVNVHSDDAAVAWMPRERLLLAGDTMEDTVTYVDEPEGFEAHLEDLERLRDLGPDRILPSHGDPQVLAEGGYRPGLITATQDYIRTLQRCRDEPALRSAELADLVSDAIDAGWIQYFAPYEAVHRHNVETVLASTS